MSVPQATIGRILLYTYAPHDLDAEHQHLVGESRPAVVVKVWKDEFVHEDGTKEPGYNLQVMTDGHNDGHPKGTYWATSRRITIEPIPGACHWPPRV